MMQHLKEYALGGKCLVSRNQCVSRVLIQITAILHERAIQDEPDINSKLRQCLRCIRATTFEQLDAVFKKISEFQVFLHVAGFAFVPDRIKTYLIEGMINAPRGKCDSAFVLFVGKVFTDENLCVCGGGAAQGIW